MSTTLTLVLGTLAIAGLCLVCFVLGRRYQQGVSTIDGDELNLKYSRNVPESHYKVELDRWIEKNRETAPRGPLV